MKTLIINIIPTAIALAIMFAGMVFGLKWLGEVGVILGFTVGILLGFPVSSVVCYKIEDIFE